MGDTHRYDGKTTHVGCVYDTEEGEISQPIGALTSATRSYTAGGLSNESYEYAYDNVGNRTDGLGLVGSTTDFSQTSTFNSLNQIIGLTYDSRGNALSDGTHAFGWDAADRLTTVDTTTLHVDYAYDPDGRRVEKKVYTVSGTTRTLDTTASRRFAWAGGVVVAEFDLSNHLLTSYAWSPLGGLLAVTDHRGATPITYRVIQDGTGSVVGLIAPDGTVAATYRYDPYGRQFEPIGPAADVCNYRFAGGYRDAEDGLQYHLHRYYSPEQGRWLSRDPIAEAGGVNVYGYCGGDPVNGNDQFGYCFAAGTLVVLADGSTKAIEQIRGGDIVLAVPEHDPEGPIEPRPVVEVYHNKPAKILRLYVGGTSEHQVIRSTHNHPFYVKGRGWLKAAELKVGDVFRQHDGDPVNSGGAILVKVEDRGEIEPVFNLHIGRNHTFFVMTNAKDLAILVHNESPMATGVAPVASPAPATVVAPVASPAPITIVAPVAPPARRWYDINPPADAKAQARLFFAGMIVETIAGQPIVKDALKKHIGFDYDNNLNSDGLLFKWKNDLDRSISVWFSEHVERPTDQWLKEHTIGSTPPTNITAANSQARVVATPAPQLTIEVQPWVPRVPEDSLYFEAEQAAELAKRNGASLPKIEQAFYAALQTRIIREISLNGTTEQRALLPQLMAAGNGMKPPIVPKAPAPGRDDRPNRHHRLPRQFKKFFQSRGLDIEHYTRDLPESQHIGSPDGIHPKGYNPRWEEWILTHEDATQQQVLDFMRQLENEFGLPPLP